MNTQYILSTLYAAIGGKEFDKIGSLKPYKFTPEVLGFLTTPAYGLRLEVGKNKAVLLVIYDEGADLYIVYAGKCCKNTGKIYKDCYNEDLIGIIETEADEKFPNLECPEFEFKVTDWN